MTDHARISISLEKSLLKQLDRAVVADGYPTRSEAVKSLISTVIVTCKRRGKYVGICGRGPSDYPDFARWLLEQGIDTMSLNPDTVVDTWLQLAAAGSAA